MAGITEDWQIQIGDLLMGSGTPYGLVGATGLLDLPSIDTNDQSLPDQNGTRRGNDRVRSRTIVLTIEVDPTVVGARALIDSITPNTETTFFCRLPPLAEGLPQWCSVKVRRRDWPLDLQTFYGLPIVRFELNASDPRLYGDVLSASAIGSGLGDPGGQLTWPLTWPLVWSDEPVLGNDEVLTVNNSGNVDTDATMLVTGCEVSPRIEMIDSGETIGWDGVLQEGERLTFDTAARRLTSSARSESDLFSGIVGDWFQFPPGQSRLILTEASEATTPQLLVRWAPAIM